MTNTLTHSATRLAGAAGLTALFLLGTAGGANASCAFPPSTSGSTFTGTVLTTQNNDRIAQVRTDAGAEVTVLGTESPDGTSASSVDRTFLAGARYEFHPINDTTPYRDNACTATRQLTAAAERTPTAKREPTAPKAKPAKTKAEPTAAPAVTELPLTGVPGYLPVTALLLIPAGAALTYRFRSVRPATR